MCDANYTVSAANTQIFFQSQVLNLKPSIEFQFNNLNLSSFFFCLWSFSWICIGTYHLQQKRLLLCTRNMVFAIPCEDFDLYWNWKRRKILVFFICNRLTSNMCYSVNKYLSFSWTGKNLIFLKLCLKLFEALAQVSYWHSFFCHLNISDWFAFFFVVSLSLFLESLSTITIWSNPIYKPCFGWMTMICNWNLLPILRSL